VNCGASAYKTTEASKVDLIKFNLLINYLLGASNPISFVSRYENRWHFSEERVACFSLGEK
jgi:hypothetical protein